MPFTQPYGFDGPIYEADWARLAALLGTRYSVESTAAWRVTPVVGERAVNIAPGRAQGTGVISETDSDTLLGLPTPTSAARWYLIVHRKRWNPAEGQAQEEFVGIGHLTTGSTAVPSGTPTSYPTGYLSEAGVVDDHPLAWVWVPSGSTNLVVWDLRRGPSAGELLVPGASLLLAKASKPEAFSVPKTGAYNTILSLGIGLNEPTLVQIEGRGQWRSTGNAAGRFDLFVGGTADADRVSFDPSGYSHNLDLAASRIDLHQTARVLLPAGATQIYLRASTDSGSSAARSFQFSTLTVWRG